MRRTCSERESRGLVVVVVMLVGGGCGSRRIAGYLAELEGEAASEAQTTGASESGEDATTADSDAGEGGSSGHGGTTGEDTTGTDTGAGGSTTTVPGTTSGDSTGEPVAQCGNGVLEVFGAVPEECDDGNLDPDDAFRACKGRKQEQWWTGFKGWPCDKALFHLYCLEI